MNDKATTEEILSDMMTWIRQLDTIKSGMRQSKGRRTFESMLLEHGKLWTANAWSSHKYGMKGTQRECFSNATKLATAFNLTYVEGLAMQYGMFPMEHAWCVDDNGNVIDNTWITNSAVVYYGLPLKYSFVVKSMSETGVYGVFDCIGPCPAWELYDGRLNLKDVLEDVKTHKQIKI
jgi:hypothetical protein